MLSLALISLTLSAPPLVGVPSVRPGDELIYIGDTVEESLHTDPPTRRRIKFEIRYFILAVRDGRIDLAALTLERVQDDAVIARAVAQVSGAAKDGALKPPAARLELLRYDSGSSIQILMPAVLPPPIVLNDRTPVAASRDTIEAEAWPMRPIAGVKPGIDWIEPATKVSPARSWSAKVPIVLDGAEVIEFHGRQTSDDWERPTSADRPWSRTLRVWLSPADGLARVVWRRIEKKEGSRLVTRAESRLDWKPTVAHRGESYDRVKREIEFAWWFDREWTASPQDQRPALMARIRRYCEDYPPTAYREAVEAVVRRAAAVK